VNLFGYTLKDLLGKRVNILIQKKVSEKHDKYVSSYLAGSAPKIIGTSGRRVTGRTQTGEDLSLQVGCNVVGALAKKIERLAIEKSTHRILIYHKEMKNSFI